MRRISTVGLALGFGLFGAAADASANGRFCTACGPTRTTRVYKTIHPLLYMTRYHDRTIYHHVTRLHYVVDVTRVQPIVHVNDVTRVHHITIVHDAYAYPAPVQVQIPDVDDAPRPAYASGCGCVADPHDPALR